jgi:hypothetical protein
MWGLVVILGSRQGKVAPRPLTLRGADGPACPETLRVDGR